jgi:hypothetical protein
MNLQIKSKIVAIVLFASLAFGQVGNYTGDTASQLSGITAGSTNIASKAYWTSNAYAQIKALFDALNYATITVNDSTPNITDAKIFYTANTSATSVTSLAWSVTSYRKDILIHVKDNYTTFVDSESNLDLGGVDLAPQSGDVLQFTYDGTKWRGWFVYIDD